MGKSENRRVGGLRTDNGSGQTVSYLHQLLAAVPTHFKGAAKEERRHLQHLVRNTRGEAEIARKQG